MIPVRSIDELQIYRPRERALDLARRLECSPLAASVLDSRFSDEERCRRQLDPPGLRPLLESLDLGAASRAALDLWTRAVPGKRVFVYGDYDVDGVSSTVLALELAEESGAASAVYYIPDRRSEGYGMRVQRIRDIVADGFETLIVVDCGSKDVECVNLAREAGMNVIIFDHHAAEGQIVRLDTLVNPQIFGDEEARGLCATAVLWCWAWQSRIMPERRLAPLVQLAALATVADCMPLGCLNRAITREGLRLMRASPLRGLLELVRALCPDEQMSMIDESFLAMRLIPCLNAAGRLRVADVAVNVLSGLGSRADLQRSVAELIDLNRRRRDLSASICARINTEIARGESAQVLFDGGWPVGILSAIASRLCSEHNKAFALAAPSGNGIRGTLRVPEGGNAVEMLKSLDSLLEAWGGHKSAAGFSVDHLKWPSLSRELDGMLHSVKAERPRDEVIEFSPSRITGSAWRDMLRLGPFGNGNPPPKFFAPYADGTSFSPLGRRGLHMRVSFDGCDLLAFGAAGQIEGLRGLRGWIYRPRFNSWQGRVSLQYVVDSIVVA